MSSQNSLIPFEEIQHRRNHYEEIRYVELKEIASDLKIKGRSKMRKQELIDAIMVEWCKTEEKNRTRQVSQIPNLVRVKTLIICRGYTIEEGNLVRCENVSDKKHCFEHEHRYRFDKPDECPVCMDTISEIHETPLECGHWIHRECLIPTNLHICPVCRQQMKPHEIEYIFGLNHFQHNQYAENYYLPFMPNPIVNVENFSLFQNQISDYNNQEHYFNEDPQYSFGNDNYENDYPNDYENENYDFDNNQPVYNDYNNNNEENGFLNYSNDNIDLIIREIETSPRHNPYVTLSSNLNRIVFEHRENFIGFINRSIEFYLNLNDFNFDEMFIDMIRERFLSIENNYNLIAIHYNLLCVPNIGPDFGMRISTLIEEIFASVYDELTFNN